MDYLFDAIISLLAVVVTYYLVPYLKTLWTAQEQSAIDYWIGIAISAAEQIFGSGEGQAKLEYVVQYLADKGLSVSTEEIEAAVYWAFNSVTSED